MHWFSSAGNLFVKVWFAYSRFIFGTPPLFTIFAPEYFHVRTIFRFVKSSLATFSKGQYILDIGCGDQRYRKYVRAGITYLGMDYAQTRNTFYSKTAMPDIIGDVRAIPLESNCIDYILCTEVLEHVNSTSRAMAEVSRVLKPAGRLIMTVPFIFPGHDYPYDYYRFTVEGIKFVCKQADLKIDKTVTLGGLGTIFVDLLDRVLGNLMSSTTFGKMLFYSCGLFALPLVYLLFNIIGYFLNFIPLSSFYSGVGIICKKTTYGS